MTAIRRRYGHAYGLPSARDERLLMTPIRKGMSESEVLTAIRVTAAQHTAAIHQHDRRAARDAGNLSYRLMKKALSMRIHGSAIDAANNAGVAEGLASVGVEVRRKP